MGIISFQNSYVKTLTSDVIVLGNGVFRVVIKVKRDHKSGALIAEDLCPYKEARW